MPLNDYECPKCEHTEIDKMVRIKDLDDPVPCEKCNTPMTKLIGGNQRVKFNYSDTYDSEKYQNAKEKAKSDKQEEVFRSIQKNR
jgi:putative FmdB family regulatory protein